MNEKESLIKGLAFAWEYIRVRKNPTATPKARAMSAIRKAADFIKGQPEIVRCKECKYSMITTIVYLQDSKIWCKRHEKHCPHEWYCADGEREEKTEK